MHSKFGGILYGVQALRFFFNIYSIFIAVQRFSFKATWGSKNLSKPPCL